MPPIDTAVAELKFVPEIVTVELLEAQTVEGLNDEIVGAGVTANMA